MPTDEDKRQAVGITVTLSSQIMAAGLAMLGVHGAFTTFLIDKRETAPLFWACAAITFGGFILGVFFGGRGIRELSHAGYAGKWDLSKGKPLFNKQAVFSLVGIAGFAGTILFAGPSKPSVTPNELVRFDSALAQLRSENNALRSRIDAFDAQAALLRTKVDSIMNPATASQPRNRQVKP